MVLLLMGGSHGKQPDLPPVVPAALQLPGHMTPPLHTPTQNEPSETQVREEAMFFLSVRASPRACSER